MNAQLLPRDEHDLAIGIPISRFLFIGGYERWTGLDGGLTAAEEETLEALVYAGLLEFKHTGQVWLRDHGLRVDFTIERSGAWAPDEPEDREILAREIFGWLPLDISAEEVPVSRVVFHIQRASFARLTTEGERRRMDIELGGMDPYLETLEYIRVHSVRTAAAPRSLRVDLNSFRTERPISRTRLPRRAANRAPVPAQPPTSTLMAPSHGP